jgi:dTDP-4-dehydrorhamnose reductase
VNAGQTTWHDLAQLIAARLGVTTGLVPVRVADVQMRAPRPQYCALSNAKLAAAGVVMPPWEDAIARHLPAPPGTR